MRAQGRYTRACESPCWSAASTSRAGYGPVGVTAGSDLAETLCYKSRIQSDWSPSTSSATTLSPLLLGLHNKAQQTHRIHHVISVSLGIHPSATAASKRENLRTTLHTRSPRQVPFPLGPRRLATGDGGGSGGRRGRVGRRRQRCVVAISR